MSRPLLGIFIFFNITTLILLAYLFIYPRLQKQQNSKPTVSVPTNDIEEGPPIKDLGNFKTIKVKSDIPGVSASLLDRFFLYDRLTEIKFWDLKGVTIYKPDGFPQNQVQAYSLEIQLTDKPQTLGGFQDENGETYQAFGMDYDVNTHNLVLKIYIKPDSEQLITSNDSKSHYSWMILYTLYYITHPGDKIKDITQQLEGVQDFTESMNGLPNKTFIQITK